jgi:hypothetical protein
VLFRSLSIRLKAAAGKDLSIVAVDFWRNAAVPSKTVKAD